MSAATIPTIATPRATAAGYAASLLAGDGMAEFYRLTFSADERAEMLERAVVTLGRRVGTLSGRTQTEVGDSLVKAAGLIDHNPSVLDAIDHL